MVTLRRLAAADLNAILTIQQASPEAAQWSGAGWREFVATGEDSGCGQLPVGPCAWVAETDGAAAGFLAVLFSGEEIEILSLAVLPQIRREGVASQLLDGALAAVRHYGAKRAFLEVRASNAGAIAFYERHGFRLAGGRKDYYKAPVEDALVLSLAL